MRTHKNLYAQIASPTNVTDAFREATRGKRRRPAVARFLLRQEEALQALQRELAEGTWQPRGYRTLVLSDPKRRLISAAPFRDRVVHHAIHRIIEPVLSARFIDDSFACRPERGTHRAVLRFQQGLRQQRWVGRVDVRRYFLEIDWDILLGIITRKIRDRRGLDLLEKVLSSGAGLYSRPKVLETLGLRDTYVPRRRKGLPIGSLTSQLFANLYLDGADHFAKRQLKVPLYLRYMDDMVVFGPSRATVDGWCQALAEWLATERSLAVHEGQSRDTRHTFRFLGHVVSRDHRRVANRAIRRLGARLRAEVDGGISNERSAEVAEKTSALVRSWLV